MMFRSYILVFFVLKFQLNNAQIRFPQMDGKIVGGNAVDIENYPYQVSLQQPNHFCGGSLISSEWILSAGHCGVYARVADLKVRTSTSKWNEGGEVFDVSQIVIHPNYNIDTLSNDFSLIQLAMHVKFNEIARPISLVSSNFWIRAGTSVVVSGWGETLNPVESTSQLRSVQLPVVAKTKCNTIYQFLGGVDDSMICAGFENGGKDSCFGDSGGPLALNGLQIGVVSWGIECASPIYPGVYARVSYARSWINQVTGI